MCFYTYVVSVSKIKRCHQTSAMDLWIGLCVVTETLKEEIENFGNGLMVNIQCWGGGRRAMLVESAVEENTMSELLS